MHLELNKLFQREMTRKEFILYLITFLLLVSGISTLIKNLTTQLNNNSGFGSGPYGGRVK